MIFTESTIKISNNVSKMDSTIVLYRGDKNVEIRFTILQSPFKYSNTVATNVIESTNASYGQLVIKTPNDKPPIFSEVSATKEGTVLFTITKEMIDEIEELGVYTFQIRLMDENKQSRVTIPPVENGIEIKEPIAIEDDNTTNVVGLAKANYAVVTSSDVDTPTFDDNGKYNKTNWNDGDIITNASLNKIEDGIYTTNENITTTKKYVDDNAVILPLPIHTTLESTSVAMNIVNIMDLISGVQYSTHNDPNETKKQGYRVVYICDDGNFKTICNMPLPNKVVHLLKVLHYTNYSILSVNNTVYKVDYSKHSIVDDVQITKTLQDYLPITNTIEYNPTKDYHPATKKYVDDRFICSDLVENVGTITKEEMQKCNNGTSRYVSSINLKEFFADYKYCAYQGMYGDKSVRMIYDPQYNRVIAYDLDTIDTYDITLGFEFNSNYMYPFNGGASQVKSYQFTNDLVITKNIILNPSEVLTKNNTHEYTPTNDYNPATKKYVDDSKIAYTISSKVLATVPTSDIKIDNSITVSNASINGDRRYYMEFLGSKKLCSLLLDDKVGNTIICNINNYKIEAFEDSTNITISISKINDTINDETFTDLVIHEEEIKYLDSKYIENDLILQNSISLGRVGDIGVSSSAIGYGVRASGDFSHAEGSGTTASGMSSHAEGNDASASGNYSHAEGDSSTASGYASHAEGSTTTASGVNSHAEGDYTTASGASSHAEGYGSKASSQFQHVQGKYNIEDKDRKYAHIVGNGAGDAKRSNAHTLDWKGNGWYAGKLSQEGTPIEDKDLVTKKYVDDKIKTDLGTSELTTTAKDIKGAVNELNTQYKDIAKQTITTEERTKLSSLSNYDDTNIKKEINGKANVDDVRLKNTNITLNDCDSAMLSAIQGGQGTSFELLSIPRDGSVTASKLDASIKDTLYRTTIIDDSSITRKGTVGGSDLYIINNVFENCTINSITLSCSGGGVGQIRIYEKNENIVTLIKSIDFNTSTLGTNTPKIEINYEAKKTCIGFTKTGSSGSIDFGTKNTFGFYNCLKKKDEQSFDITEATVFDNFSMKVLIETNKIIDIATKEDLDNIGSGTNNSYVVVDKNGKGDYTTITEAINNYNGIPIFIRNGLYEEGRLECADKNITMIGEDKYRTIIANYGGLYGNDCLYASNGTFSNMSFISEIKEGVTPSIGNKNGAYAVHVDSNNQAEGTCVFNDCIMISDFNASFGNGLRKNNTVELNNCDLICRQENRGQDYANGGMGALFTHNNHTGTGDNCPNQVIRLNNCRLKAKLKTVIRIQEVSKTNSSATLDINNCLIYSETSGISGVIKYGSVNSFNEMSIWKLSNTSYGNSVPELNKF